MISHTSSSKRPPATNPLMATRGTRFTLSRDELLTLPEFVLLSLFPNGLLPDGHMNSFHEGDIYPVDVSSVSRRERKMILLIDPR